MLFPLKELEGGNEEDVRLVQAIDELGWRLAVAAMAASGCGPTLSAQEGDSSRAAHVEPTVATVRVDGAVRPAVHSSVDAPPAKSASPGSRLGRRRRVLPDLSRNGLPTATRTNDPTIEIARRAGARVVEDFAMDRRLVRACRLGTRSGARISSRTACSIGATAAICRA